SFDQEVIIAVDIGRITKLPGQEDGALGEIVRQDGRAIAAVIGLTLLRLPLAIGAAPIERRGFQDVVVVGEQPDVFDANAVGNAHAFFPECNYGVLSRPSSHLAYMTRGCSL